jgi:hypothetical protein
MNDNHDTDKTMGIYRPGFPSLSANTHAELTAWLQQFQTNNHASSSEKCSARILLSTLQRVPTHQNGTFAGIGVPQKKAKSWITKIADAIRTPEEPPEYVEPKEWITVTDALERIKHNVEKPRIASLEAMKFIQCNAELRNFDDICIFLSHLNVEECGTRVATAALRATAPYIHPRHQNRDTLRHAWKELRGEIIKLMLANNDKPERLLIGLLHDL